jgi:N-glycosylase/DNA lyase
MSDTIIAFPLVGPAGEPVAFAQTITGHGVTGLAPFLVDEERRELHATLSLPGQSPRRVTVRVGASNVGEIAVPGRTPDRAEAAAIRAVVRHVLRLDDDLSAFYALAGSDPALAWVITGAGRLTRCQTVFEEVVKTICTTNCAWSATVRMVDALVAELGEPAVTTGDEPPSRAFPTPEAMANADETFYRTRVRCGYRGAYLRALAEVVATGRLDLERFAAFSSDDLPDDELAKHLLALPGVGPYAASHIMLMLGRYSRPIFDSWTRPAYAAATGEHGLSDREIAERFARYGRYAGLAFWMTVTKSWHVPAEPPASHGGQSSG